VEFESLEIITTGGTPMNEDRVYGTAKNLGGKAEEGFGRVTGDIKSQVQITDVFDA
jgi:hypothetical protein